MPTHVLFSIFFFIRQRRLAKQTEHVNNITKISTFYLSYLNMSIERQNAPFVLVVISLAII